MTETKLVHGVLLERRTCACGCGQSWFAKPGSPAIHSSKYCTGNEAFSWGPGTTDNSRKNGQARRNARLPAGRVSGKEMAERLGVHYSRLFQLVSQRRIPWEPIPGSRGKCFDPDAVREAYGKDSDRRRKKTEETLH